MCSVEIGRGAARYRLRPTRAQEARLERAAGARRFIYNWALERWQSHYSATGRTISLSHLFRELTTLKRRPGFEWLGDVDSQLLQQAIFDLRAAFVAFFERRGGYPRFRSRKRGPTTFRIPQRVQLRGETVRIPKVGWVRVRVSRPLVGVPRSATFKRDATGAWYVIFVCEFALPEVAEQIDRDTVVGMDVGVRDLVVLSDATRVQAPRFYAAAERRIRRAHRAVSRTEPGSRNRDRQRKRLARVHIRVARRRQDFLHKLSRALVDRYGALCIEDLGVKGLARTKLSKTLGDAGLSELRRQLEYKARWAGKPIVIVDRFFPSSRLCGACGAVNAHLKPRQRVWRCACGAQHDRDVNAARNLRAEGLKKLVAVGYTDTENACGAHVSLPMGAVSAEAGTASDEAEANMDVLCSCEPATRESRTRIA
jgi:putative transposase